jgi:transcriptional regulator of acetoin/glycerol metabolism
MIERAVVIAEAETLTVDDMPAELFQADVGLDLPFGGAVPRIEDAVVPASNFRSERDRFEREQLVRALAAAAGNKAEAARILGIARSTLVSRLKKLGIEN